MKKSVSKIKKASSAKPAAKSVVKVNDALPAAVKTKTIVAKNSAPAKPAAPVKKHVLYAEITPDKYFVLCDGRKIKSAKELADVLQLINDDMFRYHVTDTKNDFANWINDVFGEQDLAKKLRTVRNRFETSIEIYREMFGKLDRHTKGKK